MNEEDKTKPFPLTIGFPGVDMDGTTYAVVSKKNYQLEELDKVWVIKNK